MRRIPPFQANRTPGTTEDPDLDARFRALEARHVELDRYLGVLIGQVAPVAAPPVVEAAGASEGGGDSPVNPGDYVLRAGDTMTGTLNFDLPAASSIAVLAGVDGDSVQRFYLDAEGRLAWGSGSGARDVNLYRVGVDSLGTDDHFVINSAGSGLKIKEGANAYLGVTALIGGTITVANIRVTANTRIFVFVQTPGGTQGFLHISARVAGTSFTITSTSATETSTLAWLLIEPA